MYLTDFLFDMGKAKGIFSGDRTGNAPPGKGAFYASPNWLELSAPKPPSFATGAFAPDATTWTDLGEVKLWPNKPKRSHRYQFSVGAIIEHDRAIRHSSHAPEMDVTT